jgi:tRNA-2-methylthio-N6-dimethylallyladenosine synthase
MIPRCGLTTELFCGFHLRNTEDHQETLSLMREVGFDSAFLFSIRNART